MGSGASSLQKQEAAKSEQLRVELTQLRNDYNAVLKTRVELENKVISLDKQLVETTTENAKIKEMARQPTPQPIETPKATGDEAKDKVLSDLTNTGNEYTGPLPMGGLYDDLTDEAVLEEFRRSKVPSNQTLQASYPCAVVMGVPMVSRLFITEDTLAFRAVAFGVVLTRIIPMKLAHGVVCTDNSLSLTLVNRNLHLSFYFAHEGEAAYVNQAIVKAQVRPAGDTLSDSGHTSSSLTVADMEMIMRGAKVSCYKKNEVVLQEGKSYQNLFQVLQGSLAAQLGKGDEVTVLSVMQEGDVFGEMSFLEGGSASASVVAAEEDCMVCHVEKSHLDRVAEVHPEFSAHLFKFLAITLAKRVVNLSKLAPSININKEAAKRSLRRRVSVTAGPEGETSKEPIVTSVQYSIFSEVGASPSDPFKQNQDNYCVYETIIAGEKVSFFGVFDGHGEFGHDVSRMVRELIPKNIFTDDFEKDPDGCIMRGFLKTNEAVENCGMDVRMSGTTAVTIIKWGKNIISANVGDSRAIMGRRDGTGPHGRHRPIELTLDQKPELEEELQRIFNSGGQVTCFVDDHGNPDGPCRVFIAGEAYPGLAMSRSIGDTLGKQCGVIAEPVIRRTEITDQDKYLVLASDGVWEFLSNQEVTNIVGGMTNPEGACRKLVFDAKQEWDKRSIQEGGYRDDVTALVVFL